MIRFQLFKILDDRKANDERFLIGENFLTLSANIPFAKQLISKHVAEMKVGPKLLQENKIFDINEQVFCQGSRLQWTNWLSEERIAGDDFELLENYQKYYK